MKTEEARASYWCEQKRSRPKRWYKGNASRFELALNIEEKTAYPMEDSDEPFWFEGFAVCWRGVSLFQELLYGATVEVHVVYDADDAVKIQGGTFAVQKNDDYTMMHDNVLSYKPDLLKSPRSHPFVFMTLEEAQEFVDALQSITVSQTSRRGA